MARTKEIRLVKCYDCRFATLMRSSELNPIVAHCNKKGERNVASITFQCPLFQQSYDPPVIHPMKPLR